MLDLQFEPGAGGDASAETPSAEISETASESVETPVLEPANDAQPETNLSGADTPADPTSEQEPVDEEAALLAAANDPNTPQWARAKIQEAMGYAGKLKNQLGEYQSKVQAFESQAALPQPELERLQQAENTIFELQSITATPELIGEKLKGLVNPTVLQDFQNETVWNALFTPEGTPDLGNLQTVVDKVFGHGSVKADDLIQAGEALKNGKLSRDDFHSFESDEAYQSYQRQQQLEAQLQERQAQADKNLVYQEEQIRTQHIGQAIGQIQNQMNAQIGSLCEKFKLAPVQGEPKEATAYKNRVNERIAQAVNSATGSVRELGEISKALDMLSKARKVDGPQAVNEIQQYLAQPFYQQNVNKGLATVLSNVEKIVAEEARMYQLMMKGLEIENSKGQSARPIPGQPNQAASLPNLTQEQLKTLSAREQNDYLSEQLTNELRGANLSYGSNRVGQIG